jgi:hypothetical protein
MHRVTDLGIWLVPVAAIVVWGAVEIVKMLVTHDERVKMIERGMNPDSVNPDGAKKDE